MRFRQQQSAENSMTLMTDLLWIAGAALSLGFLAYGAFLLFFVPKSDTTRVTAAPRLRPAS
jgi:hypothetical protein